METFGIIVFLALCAWGLWAIDRGLASGQPQRDESASSSVPTVPWY